MQENVLLAPGCQCSEFILTIYVGPRMIQSEACNSQEVEPES
jgi:hypothetical protein